MERADRSQVLDDEVISKLSPRGRSVIGLSREYARRLTVIHMEHLIFALVDRGASLMAALLRQNGLNRMRLAVVLAKFDVPRTPLKAASLEPPVWVSPHVDEAIRAADAARTKRQGRQIRNRDLLAGCLSVSDCEVIQRLAQVGITLEAAERAIQAAEAEEPRRQGEAGESAIPAEQPVRLDQTAANVPPPEGATPATNSPVQEQSSTPSQAAISPELERIRNALIQGDDDMRQTIIDELASKSSSVDYNALRSLLIRDLNGDFHAKNAFRLPEPRRAPGIRSWALTALGWISTANDRDAVDTLVAFLNPEEEPDEMVRYWSLEALARVTPDVYSYTVSEKDRDGLVGMLAAAVRDKRRGAFPSELASALESNESRGIWCALRALQIVAFPVLITRLCDFLPRAKGLNLTYDTIQALAHPEIGEEAARNLAKALGPAAIVEKVVQAAQGAKKKDRERFSRLLQYLDSRTVLTILETWTDPTHDEATRASAHALMGMLSSEIPTAPVAGYISDSIPGQGQLLKDELGFEKDVKTLSAVLLARDVAPPLAVGLFGDWGTGKSYFMEKMYRQIEELADRAATVQMTAYHSKVVQIRFNAWHYVDSSLWASLASHIFDELSTKVCPAEDPEETKRKIISQLESAKQVRVEAEAARKGAQQEKRSAENSLNDARKEREQKQVDLAGLRMPDLLDVLSDQQQQQLGTELKGLLEELGLPSALKSVQDLNEVYRQAASLAGQGEAAVLSLWRSTSRKAVFVLLAAAFLLVPLISWVVERWLHAPGTASVSAVLGDISLFVGTFAAGFKKSLAKISTLVKDLEAKRDRVLRVIEEKRKVVSKRELELHQELEKLRALEEAAQERLNTAEAKVRELEQKLEDIKAGRSLSRFLLERVQAEDYRKHLGIISLVRRDFERLSRLLTTGEEGLDKVGRIILYIDDLDRCPANKVVDVLQAVHLLLGMPLFVAIVGVDLRWLLHSLDQQYTAFHQAGEANGEDGPVRPEWISSPQSYLEKIFQIPFALKPMEPEGYENLIASLMPVSEGQHQPRGMARSTAPAAPVDAAGAPAPGLDSAQGEHGGERQPANPGDVGAPEDPTRAVKQGENAAVDSNRDLNPEALVIRSWERNFAGKLFPLIPTPRATKRFTNIYRLLKAPLTGNDLRKFEGTADRPGDFQATMLLLSITIGLPQQALELFPALMDCVNASRKWREVLTEHLTLSREQTAVLDLIKLDDGMATFVTWCPLVARFTFEAAKASRIGASLAVMSQAAGSGTT